MKRLPLAVGALVVLLAAPGRALDLFVDQANGGDANDGLSWSAAKASVTAALAEAAASPEADTVSVAAGRYIEAITVPPDAALLGGFPAGGGPRDPEVNPTLLDGDGTLPIIVHFPAGSDGTVLDGFLVRGADNPMGGAGILIEDASPLIRGNLIEENTGCYGAGIHISYSGPRAVARIERNRIRKNRGACTLRILPEGVGVGIWAPGDWDLGTILEGNVIEGNKDGPAITFRGRGRIQHTKVRGNSFGLHLQGSVALLNVEVTGNEGAGMTIRCGGGAYRLENVTLSGNGGPGLTAFPLLTLPPTDVTVLHSILWADLGGEISWQCPSGSLSVASTLVQDGWPGGLNVIDEDPLFVAGPGGDFYLSQILAGQGVTSPAVDAGSISSAAAGLDQRTTRTDSLADSGQVDLGFHYESVPSLTILRGTTADGLSPHRTVPDLPFTDDPGILTDPGLPRLFYRVPEAQNELLVIKDLAGNTLRLEFLSGR